MILQYFNISAVPWDLQAGDGFLGEQSGKRGSCFMHKAVALLAFARRSAL
jgi:hypothetical protein